MTDIKDDFDQFEEDLNKGEKPTDPPAPDPNPDPNPDPAPEPPAPDPDPTPDPDPKPSEPPSYNWGEFGEEFTDAGAVKKFIDTSKTQLNQSQEKVKELESRNPFSDEMLYKLDHVKRTNPDDYELAQKLAFGTMTPTEVLKLQLESNSPAFKALNNDAKDRYLGRQYKLGHNLKPLDPEVDSEDDVTERNNKIREADDDVAFNKTKLEMDAENAKKELTSKVFGDIKIPEHVSPETTKAKEVETLKAFTSTWDQAMGKVDLKEIQVPMKDGDKVSTLMSIDLSAADLTKYKTELRDILANGKVDPKTVSQSEITDYVQKRYREDHLPELVYEIFKKTRGMSDDEVRDLAFNSQRQNDAQDQAHRTVVDEKTTESEVDKMAKSF